MKFNVGDKVVVARKKIGHYNGFKIGDICIVGGCIGSDFWSLTRITDNLQQNVVEECIDLYLEPNPMPEKVEVADIGLLLEDIYFDMFGTKLTLKTIAADDLIGLSIIHTKSDGVRNVVTFVAFLCASLKDLIYFAIVGQKVTLDFFFKLSDLSEIYRLLDKARIQLKLANDAA